MSTGATYIDLRLPERPAAGGLEQPPAPGTDDPQVAPATPQQGQAAPVP